MNKSNHSPIFAGQIHQFSSSAVAAIIIAKLLIRIIHHELVLLATLFTSMILYFN